MNQRTARRSLVAAALAALACLQPARARAGDVEACFTASEEGQRLRDEGRLREARARFIACGAAACPALVRSDCAGWLADVTARVPTLILSAEDDQGQDAADVRVTLDGAPLAARLDGKAVEVDPGEHVLRFERAGSDPVALRLVVREGEKLRRVSARLAPPATARAGAATPGGGAIAPGGGPLAPSEDQAASRPASSLLLPIALGGVAAAGGVAYAALGLSARADADRLRATCAPRCAEADVDAVRTKVIAANVAFGVGVAALGGAVAALLLRGPMPAAPAAAAVHVVPLPGGAAAALGARF
ncbi:hypothetical protein [Sorangium cellulosum]|uniref:PEGA domain-containing protein n=1 Tax=Sorangium cellulosum TaxID=56 RepID=A0A150QVV2_SORCE|nr:hypothetical protein [Sorangium cellulosum]KYF71942.1 hypothetical protein BE15_05280 [Sorangium cellulosum]